MHCGVRKVGRDETTQVRGGPGQELVLWGCTERATVGTSLISLSQHPCSSEEERGDRKEWMRGHSVTAVIPVRMKVAGSPAGSPGVVREDGTMWTEVHCFVHRITR